VCRRSAKDSECVADPAAPFDLDRALFDVYVSALGNLSPGLIRLGWSVASPFVYATRC